jgi:hypothetical protein
LLDGRVRRHTEAIGLAAVVGFSVLVLDVDQIILASTESLNRDVSVAVGKTSDVECVFWKLT